MSKPVKIVLTGAPSSGKSSLMEALQQKNPPGIALVPESAVVLLKGGFPAPSHQDLEQIRAFQNAILPLQENLEILIEKKFPQATHLILDRAKLDGAGFWPLGIQSYFSLFPVDWDLELARYDHVLFMELPSERDFGGTHANRFHDYAQSLESERKLEVVWSRHPRFTRIKPERNFPDKIAAALTEIERILALP